MSDRQVRDVPTYDVFITHAGEDKATIAIPLRERLADHGITAFVDELDMLPGTEAENAMNTAMETAEVAVVVLSPEFVARKWPMKELMCFTRRRAEAAEETGCRPVIIPFFYRLSIDQLYGEPRLDRTDKDGRSIYHKSRFFERMNNGEPEANIEEIKKALRKLHGIMGVRNDIAATNDSSYVMSRRREILIQTLRKRVTQVVSRETVQRDANMTEARGRQPIISTNRSTFEIFISHARPDKLKIADPICEDLASRNVHVFPNKNELEINDRTEPEVMERAMGEAHVGIFVLSPEFASQNWTMRALRHFVERDEKCKAEGRRRPVLFPIFYRLSREECGNADVQVYGQNSGYAEVLVRNGFFNPVRQTECSTIIAGEALKAVSKYAGVEKSRIGGGEDLSDAAILRETVRRVVTFLRR